MTMNDEFGSQAKADYARARFKAFVRGVMATLAGEKNNLLSYDEVKERLRIGGPIYRGMRTVRLDQIIGSLNRYQDFDRTFLPVRDKLAERWQSVDRAFYKEISLPPIVLYKVGDVYFVVDGHHRVSVAKEQGQEFIDAEVRECATKVNITPNIRTRDLQILSAKVDFIERTNMDRIRPDAHIILTIPDGFDRMLEHIAVHRYFMGIDLKRHISEEEGIAHWYDTVYMPIIIVIRESNILEDFPGKTEGDLYLWVLDHQEYLHQQGENLQPPADAARKFIQAKD
jgi:hypothetical protein